jgi:hypothetical protein
MILSCQENLAFQKDKNTLYVAMLSRQLLDLIRIYIPRDRVSQLLTVS